MTKTESTRVVRRGRVFPEIQWTPEQQTQWREERAAFRQRCQVIFDREKPKLMETHYNWYITIEPNSGEYFINEDEFTGAQKAHEKSPGVKLYTFRINETGVCGTI
ncbi:MAG: hypothetical protein PUP91_01275 [Rhizonema sp. PD37]|nr:hypothetical protein [Rhizonema sp. PD37]